MSVENILNQILNNSPEHLKHQGNYIKFNRVIASLLNDYLKAKELTDVYMSIINAQNYGLDRIGNIVGEDREGRTDEEFRRAIYSATIRRNSEGTREDINRFGRSLLGNNFVGIEEEDRFIRVIFNSSQFQNVEEIFKNAVAAGVRVEGGLTVNVPVAGKLVSGQEPIEFVEKTIDF